MKSNRVIATIAGILFFLSIVLSFIWLYPTKSTDQTGQIEPREAVSKIEKREIKEVNFRQSQVELTGYDGKKYFTVTENDATRESLIGSISEHNKVNGRAPIKYTEEPVSSGFGWIILINSLPVVLFFIMWGLTLAVIVYAVKTLSRNKS